MTSHDPLGIELLLTLQALYVLGKIERNDFKTVTRSIGDLSEAHASHGFVHTLLQHGLSVHTVTPIDSRELAGPGVDAYLDRVFMEGTITEERYLELVAHRDYIQSRAVYLRGYMEAWPQLTEEVRQPNAGDIQAALEHGAVVKIHARDQESQLPLLVVPRDSQNCWVYDPDGVSPTTARSIAEASGLPKAQITYLYARP